MTWGRKTGGRDLKKGDRLISPRNTKLSEEDQKIRTLNHMFARAAIERNCLYTYSELREKIKNKADKQCIELLIMRTIETAIATGDLKKLDWIYIQLFGKPAERIKEEKTITLKISDDTGKEITESDLKTMSKENLKTIITAILKDEQ